MQGIINKKRNSISENEYTGSALLKGRGHLGAILLAVFALMACIGLLFGVSAHNNRGAENIKLGKTQEEALAHLDIRKGEYDPQSIVLQDTTPIEARELSKRLGAKLRITRQGTFATLTLPEEITIRDVFSDEKNRDIIELMSPDFNASPSKLDGIFESEAISSSLFGREDYDIGDTYYSRQTYLDYLNIGNAWNLTRGGGITLAVIDTGIDTDHPEFAGKISEYSYNASEDKILKDHILEDGSYDWTIIEDENGHGTAVSGVIAAAVNGDGIVGIAPEINILVIKAECDASGNFKRTSDLLFGLYYAIERDVDVINMSFGGYENMFADAAALAVDSDIICVAAAGNYATQRATYPAADENVIGVGALADRSWDIADYSNYGVNSDIVAPGAAYTTKLGGAYGLATGTSLACPIVAGGIALYLSENRNKSFAEVRENIYASCYDIGEPGEDLHFGFGAFDINALVCEERGKITFDMLTMELENIEQLFIRNHTLQDLPEPKRSYAVFGGWYYDVECKEPLGCYSDIFSEDLTLYAKWLGASELNSYRYIVLEDGSAEICGYSAEKSHVEIPGSIDGKKVSSIGASLFSNDTKIKSVILPEGLKSIGERAFAGCKNLSAINMPSSLEVIGDSAFSDNASLSSIDFGAGSKLKMIGEKAFENCIGLYSVSFASDSILSDLGAYSFRGCTALSIFNIPGSVISIDGTAFYGADGILSFEIMGESKYFSVIDGVLTNYTKNRLVAYPASRVGEYIIPDGITHIGSAAFACSKLSRIDLNDVSDIGSYAFSKSALKSINISDSVTEIAPYAFNSSKSLSNVKLGSGISELSDSIFSECTALLRIEIPSGIVKIGKRAFYDCALQVLAFGENSRLETIDSLAFAECNLERINLPDSLRDINYGAFYGNRLLSEIKFGEFSALKSIGEQAFAQNSSLSIFDFPTELEKIGNYAFMGTALKEARLPALILMLGDGAFASCVSLENIFVHTDNLYYSDIDGVVYSKDFLSLSAYPAGNIRKEYTVNAATKKIQNSAFYGSDKLNFVNMPEGLDEIDAYAFAYASGLNMVKIPESLKKISECAFIYASLREGVEFSEKSRLSYINYGAFAYTGIKDIRLPASLCGVGQHIFEGCNYLESVTFSKGSELEYISAYMFSGCEDLKSIVFETGSSLRSIQAHGFDGMTMLECVDFGDASLENIDNCAFRSCKSLKTLRIPESVTYIGREAFFGCTALRALYIPASVEFIGSGAFDASGNIDIFFSEGVLPRELGESWDNGIRGSYVGVFEITENELWRYGRGKDGICVIEYKGNEKTVDLTQTDFGADIAKIGAYAFYGKETECVILPDNLSEICRYAFAFSSLKEIEIPKSVVFIGENALYGTSAAEAAGIHSMGDMKIYAPTCTDGGHIERRCITCNKILQRETLPVLGHDEIPHSGKEPTCTEEGFSAYVSCSKCEYTTYSEIEAKGHEKISHEGRDAACTEPGFYDYVSCTRCDYTTYSEISPLGHSPHTVLEVGKDADCLNTGWHFSVDYCLNCGEELWRNRVEDEPLGHSLTSFAARMPSCTEDGWDEYVSCSRCTYTTYEKIPAKGHDYSFDWENDAAYHWHGCECGDRQGVTRHYYTELVIWYDNEDGTSAKRAECYCGRSVSVTVPNDAKRNSDCQGLFEEAVLRGGELILKIEQDEFKIDREHMTKIKAEIKDKEAVFFGVMLFDESSNFVLTFSENVTEIALSCDLYAKENISVVRSYNGAAEELEALTERPVSSFSDGTYYTDTKNNLIYIYTNKFSTYAFAYDIIHIESPCIGVLDGGDEAEDVSYATKIFVGATVLMLSLGIGFAFILKKRKP